MVTGAYYPEVSGGGLQCRTIVRALKDQVRFTVLTTTADATLAAEEEIDGVPVYRAAVDVRRPLSKVRAAIRFVSLFCRLHRRFQIVHLHGFSQKNYLFVFLAWLAGKQQIVKLTSPGLDDPATIRARSWLGFRLYGLIDCVVSVSPRLSEIYEAAGLSLTRLRKISNGVDTDRFRPATPSERLTLRTSLGLPTERPVVLFVGFFSRDKCPDVLFGAWARIRRETTHRPVLVFVGATRSSYYEVDRDLVRRIRAAAQALDAKNEVVFVERTSMVENYYRAADVFVLPSVREGLPNALLEAMAAGLACVATDLRGVTNWIVRHRENGLLFPPADMDALAEQLEQLLDNPQLARTLGASARATVLKRCSIQDVAKRYFDLYTSLRDRAG